MDKTIRQALIIAAGRGMRFGAATDSRPKPLLEVAGVSLLCRTLLTARQAGIDHFTIVTGYRGEVLEEFPHVGKQHFSRHSSAGRDRHQRRSRAGRGPGMPDKRHSRLTKC